MKTVPIQPPVKHPGDASNFDEFDEPPRATFAPTPRDIDTEGAFEDF